MELSAIPPTGSPKPDRPYYYTDPITGALKKHLYCSLCLSGPYKEEDIKIKIFPFTDNLSYCKSCAINHRLKIEIKEPEPKIISLKDFSGKQIIAKVQELTGKFITTSPKSKKLILKQAQLFLKEAGYTIQDLPVVEKRVKKVEEGPIEKVEGIPVESIPEEPVEKVSEGPIKKVSEEPIKKVNGSLEGLSAKQIIQKVFELSGQQIIISLKSKRLIIRKAREILSNLPNR